MASVGTALQARESLFMGGMVLVGEGRFKSPSLSR